MAEEHRAESPTVDQNWWVDTGTTTGARRPGATAEPPLVGARFFDIGYHFDQEQAKVRLTDSNLKTLEEARPTPGVWSVVHTIAGESLAAPELERLKGRLPLPPEARGVIVDAAGSVRCIVTGEPVGERVLEYTFGAAASFDCWIRGEWVCERVFQSADDALAHAERYVPHYLTAQPEHW